MNKLASVAAPVLDGHGIAMAAISITGSSLELGENPDRQARLVTMAAHHLAKVMQARSLA